MRLCIVCTKPVLEFTRGDESRWFHTDPETPRSEPYADCRDLEGSVASVSIDDVPPGRSNLFHVKHVVSDTAHRCPQCHGAVQAAVVAAPALTRTREAVMISCPLGCSAAMGPLMSVSEYETIIAQLLAEVEAVPTDDTPAPL